MLSADQRADLHVLLVAGPDDHLRGGVAQRVEERVRRLADGDRDGAGETALTGVAERRVEQRWHALLGIGVGQEDDVFLGPAVGLLVIGPRLRSTLNGES